MSILGFAAKNTGTLSDESGAFEFTLSPKDFFDSLRVSAIGYQSETIPLEDFLIRNRKDIALIPDAIELETVIVKGKKQKLSRAKRWGWMGGKHGILPVDPTLGGAALALYIEAPQAETFKIDLIQLRIMYSTESPFRFRLHLYEVDPITKGPGKELTPEAILLEGHKKIGWTSMDLNESSLYLDRSTFFIGLEWITTPQQRAAIAASLAEWEQWKVTQFHSGNPKVEIIEEESGPPKYRYNGNMKDWPGFEGLPSLTGIMVEDKDQLNAKSRKFRTYMRKHSFADWEPLESVANMVVRMRY